MKLMIPMFYDIAHKVRDTISKQITHEPKEMDMLLWVSRTALELIGIAGLGYSFESFDEDAKPSAYTKAVKGFQYDIFLLFKVSIFHNNNQIPQTCDGGPQCLSASTSPNKGLFAGLDQAPCGRYDSIPEAEGSGTFMLI
jgi:hypothetical protein